MVIRIALSAAALYAFAAPAIAQAPAGPAPTEQLVKVAFETSAGRILVEVDKGRAPITAGNFLRYVDSGRFNGESFYRAMPYTPGEGLIQGGITSDSAKLYPAIKHEPTNVTGLKHVAGALSVARGEPGSARADFFILTTDIPGLDANPAGEGDNQGYAAFGKVVEGMDVVRKIFVMPTSPTKGEGILKGQMLEPTVKIVKAARVN